MRPSQSSSFAGVAQPIVGVYGINPNPIPL